MSPPCEFIVKNVIPSIRKEVVKILSEDYGMCNRDIARRLGLTDAAVSQYLTEKRGKGFEPDEEIRAMLRESADRIFRGSSSIDSEVCKICKEIKRRLGEKK
ncbi:MAG: transcriptional regulator [Thermoplasmata archaeon]|nr:MAG: transcriptional regulator [Thermoplasmata archaeon]